MKEFRYEYDGLLALGHIPLVENIYRSLESLFPNQKPTKIKIVGTPTKSNGMIFQYDTGIVAVVHANYKASQQVGPYEHQMVPVRGFISAKVFPVSENDLVFRVENCVREFHLVPREFEESYFYI